VVSIRIIKERIFKQGGVRKFDVGLHALTNYIEKGEKGKPFSKLLKQLRFRYDDFKLHPQTYSKIQFPEATLRFSNDFELLQSDIDNLFPSQKDGFNKLVQYIKDFNELDLNLEYQPSKEKLKDFISEPLLIEMIIAPLLIYGSAWENDMDFAQFVIMFKSLYFEGFSRPEGGVRTIINLLLDKYKDAGGELNFREAVEEFIVKDGKCVGVKTNKNEYTASEVFSSIGLPETYQLTSKEDSGTIGPLSFCETILCTDKKIPREDFDATIVFYNSKEVYSYQKPEKLYDNSSAVFCAPDNYEIENREGEGTYRITYMANFDKWNSFERDEYLEQKENVFEDSLKLTREIIPNFNQEILFKDVFTPTTIKRYTWHKEGTVYGSTDKSRNGKTKYDNLYVIGTDQGFLGIVGSMLSGISMANLYGLMEAR
jgi:phytoene dehydrogenase-like protein